MKKSETPVKEESYEYGKDKSITIIKAYYPGKSDPTKLVVKFNAKKDDKIAKGFPTEDGAVSEIYRKFKSSNNNNNQNQENMSKSVEELKKQLELAEKGLTKDMIKNNPVLKADLEKRIVKLKQEIKDAEGGASKKEEAPKKEAPKKEAPKKEAPKKETPKKEAPKKETKKAEKPKTQSHGKFKVGDEVTWENHRTGKKQRGTITGIRAYKGDTDKMVANIKGKDGNTYNAYLKKLEKA